MILSTFISLKNFCFVLFLIFSINLAGQSPYEINFKLDAPLLTASFMGNWFGETYIRKNVSPLSKSEIELLNPSDVNRFDRIAIDNYSLVARDLSDIILYSSLAYPALTLFSKPMRDDVIVIGILGVETLGLTITITAFTKGLTKRVRPFMYNPDISIEDKTNVKGRLSFFSGHTSGVASLTFFTAKVINDYHPKSKWKPLIWSVAAIIPATTGYLRIKGGKHYPTDVLAGYAVGATLGLLIPHIHRKNKKKRNSKLSILPKGNSVGIVMTW